MKKKKKEKEKGTKQNISKGKTDGEKRSLFVLLDDSKRKIVNQNNDSLAIIVDDLNPCDLLGDLLGDPLGGFLVECDKEQKAKFVSLNRKRFFYE